MKKLTAKAVKTVLNDFAGKFELELEIPVDDVDIEYILNNLSYDEDLFESTLEDYDKNNSTEPSGQFLINKKDSEWYAVGDNRSGNIIVEDFKSVEECILWLTEITDYEFIVKYGRTL